MLTYQDIKIPSVTSQTSGIPLQKCGSHYDLGCLATWPFLCLRSGAAFVIGDMTGTKVWYSVWCGRNLRDSLEPTYSVNTLPSMAPQSLWAGFLHTDLQHNVATCVWVVGLHAPASMLGHDRGPLNVGLGYDELCTPVGPWMHGILSNKLTWSILMPRKSHQNHAPTSIGV